MNRSTPIRTVAACVVAAILLADAESAKTQSPEGSFTDVRPVPGLVTPFQVQTPALTDDELTIFLSSGVDPNQTIMMATRLSESDPFGELVTVGPPISEPGIRENGPFLSVDGLRMYYNTRRLGGLGLSEIWVSNRTSPTEPWGDPVALGPNVNSSSNDFSPSLSPDELTLYFASDRSGKRRIYRAQRNSEDDEFGPAEMLENINTGLDEGNPTISADGLTLFYDRWDGPGVGQFGTTQQLWLATRSSTDEPFSNPMNLDDFGFGSNVNVPHAAEFTPYISRDWPAFGSKIYFGRAIVVESESFFDIYEATWVPEPSTAILSMLGLLCILVPTPYGRHSRR